MSTVERTGTPDRPLRAPPRRRREAARPGRVRRRHRAAADAARQGAALARAARAHRLDRHQRRRGDAGRRLRAHLPGSRRHRPVLGSRDPRPARDRRRQGALPRRARRRGGGRERGRGCGRRAGDPRRVRGSAGRRRRAAGDRGRCRAGARGAAPARPVPRARRAPAARRQHLLPLPHRSRRGRGRVRARGPGRRGRVHVPRDLPVRDGDAHGRRVRRGRRDHRARLLPAPVPGARRARGAVRRAALEGARDRALPRRRVRLEVVHQDGADHRRARAQGGAPRAHPQRGLRVDGHVAPPRHEGAHAHGHDQRGAAARPRGRVLVRHRCLRRQRPARHGDRRRRGTRPVPLRGLPRRRVLRVHEHGAVGLLPGVRRDAPAVDRRAADRRALAPLRPRSARGAPGQPVRARRGGARGRQAPRRGHHRRRREGRPRGRLGRAEGPEHRPRRLGRPAGSRRPSGLDRGRADGGRRRGDRARRHHRARPGRPHRLRADRRRGALDHARARHRARHRHPLHAV